MIAQSRGSNVVIEVLGKCFKGALISDFWYGYNRIEAWPKQKCLVHMFRELKKTSERNTSDEWRLFNQKFKRLLDDAIKLMKKRETIDAEDYERLKTKIYKRYTSIIEGEYTDEDINRLMKRLKRHRSEMFTFLEDRNVPFENNHAERIIMNAVIMRKNSVPSRFEWVTC